MDFDRIKPAVEEITLSDEQAAKILEACKKNKAKKHRSYWIPVAAAAAIALIVFSPSLFINLKGANSEGMADSAYQESENVKGFYYTADDALADKENGCAENYVVSSQSAASGHSPHGELYSCIPSQFSALVDESEFEAFVLQLDISNGMAILQFVEYFGIPKEDFDAVNADGLFDSGIIYSFDRTLIDEVYKGK